MSRTFLDFISTCSVLTGAHIMSDTICTNYNECCERAKPNFVRSLERAQSRFWVLIVRLKDALRDHAKEDRAAGYLDAMSDHDLRDIGMEHMIRRSRHQARMCAELHAMRRWC
jgi:uncharacterized protein YjiS (DUF1127 family)